MTFKQKNAKHLLEMDKEDKLSLAIHAVIVKITLPILYCNNYSETHKYCKEISLHHYS